MEARPAALTQAREAWARVLTVLHTSWIRRHPAWVLPILAVVVVVRPH